MNKTTGQLLEPYQQLEYEIGKWVGFPAENVVACSSGTAALHLALEAFQLPPQSEIIVPDFTMVACARAVTLAGLTPVFVDCNERMLMDLNLLEDYLSLLTSDQLPKVVMCVHVYGRTIDMEKATRIMARQAPGRFIIEDLAEAHGVKPRPRTDAACWSFYKNKIVAGEEGGAVAFRNREHAEVARSLRSLGFTDAHDFVHVPRGHNYRMSNLHAAKILDTTANRWGCWQELNNNLLRRQLIETYYNYFCPKEWKLPPRDVVWVYDFLIPGMTYAEQDRVVKALREQGIQARHAFKPMHVQPEYSKCRVVGGGVAERMSRSVVYLPVSPGVTTREDCRKAFEVIESVLKS